MLLDLTMFQFLLTHGNVVKLLMQRLLALKYLTNSVSAY